MKIKFILVGLAASMLMACSPSPTQLKKVMKEHPDIVFSAIKADPQGFFDAVQKAQDSSKNAQLNAAVEKEYEIVKAELQTPESVKTTPNDISVGSANAPVTIVEWFDFNCGHCQQEVTEIQKVVQSYGGKVRVVYKQLPILAPESKVAAQYMEAIALQDRSKALQFYNLIFANQNDFRTSALKYLKKAAKQVGANLAKVEIDARGPVVKKKIASDLAEAKQFGFVGTPSFMVNGAAIHGAYPYQLFKRVIDHILKSAPAKSS